MSALVKISKKFVKNPKKKPSCATTLGDSADMVGIVFLSLAGLQFKSDPAVQRRCSSAGASPEKSPKPLTEGGWTYKFFQNWLRVLTQAPVGYLERCFAVGTRTGANKKKRTPDPKKSQRQNYFCKSYFMTLPVLFQKKRKRKKVTNRRTTAESQGIVAQGNSNPYNTAFSLSRLQMI